MSDVFGEFIDKSEGIDDDSAWDLGEDLPNQGPARNMKDPTAAPYDQPDRVRGLRWSTGQINGSTVDNGGVHTNSGVGNKAAYLITDGATLFNGQTITGVGLTKAEQIYWRTQQMLTPGSDYADLANSLFAACTALIGTAGIDATNCANVAKATTATQMLPTFTGPSAPLNMSIVGGYHQIRVRWSPPAASGTRPVNSYVVTVTPAIGGENSLAIDDPGARDVTIGGIPAGRTLTFSLFAREQRRQQSAVAADHPAWHQAGPVHRVVRALQEARPPHRAVELCPAAARSRTGRSRCIARLSASRAIAS